MKIAIDKMIDENKCPTRMFCVVATTGMTREEAEHHCYLCWKDYCRENNIEIDYDYIIEQQSGLLSRMKERDGNVELNNVCVENWKKDLTDK